MMGSSLLHDRLTTFPWIYLFPIGHINNSELFSLQIEWKWPALQWFCLHLVRRFPSHFVPCRFLGFGFSRIEINVDGASVVIESVSTEMRLKFTESDLLFA